MRASIALLGLLSLGVMQAPAPAARFEEIAHASGIDFRHVNGASPDRHLQEIMGSGALFFDFDNDGWTDLLLVDGGSLADPALAARSHHRLYRNRGGGR
ncbi:MAG TPA: VCBS repeat-containing protein, partial [Vicinamibacterales bacterium]|nr:VCBS repeat-containing protein [Vicinamibacterales bacterium]